MAATRELLPATAIATLLARIDPREVCTPVTGVGDGSGDFAVLHNIDAPPLAPRAYPMPPRRAGPCRRDAATGRLGGNRHYRN
jgi:hypothetical protein